VSVLLLPSPHDLYAILQCLLELLVVAGLLAFFEVVEEVGDLLVFGLDGEVGFVDDLEEDLQDR
jgi:hypothetical protein